MHPKPSMTSDLAARLFRCLGEPIRLRIVALLAAEELNVNELKDILGVPQSTLSRHLGTLKEADFIEIRKQGTSSYYRLLRQGPLNGHGTDLLRILRDLTADDAEVAADRQRLAATLDSRRRAVKLYFESGGSAWDAIHRSVADPLAKQRALLRALPSDVVFVDAGCGTGYLLPELAASGARVIAVDNVVSQLEKARENMRESTDVNIEYREGDLLSMPLENGEADAVFAHLSLHHVPTPAAAITELVRILKPGGTLVVTDFFAHEEAWLQAEHADLWLGFDPEDVRRWMQAAGLELGGIEEQAYALPKSKIPGHAVAGLRLFITSGKKPQPVTSRKSS